jgi:hypothetical protein
MKQQLLTMTLGTIDQVALAAMEWSKKNLEETRWIETYGRKNATSLRLRSRVRKDR